jgi:DNA-directed RNA polymerase specialized sigma24 family protein
MTSQRVPTPNPADVHWQALSPKGAETLREIGLRVQAGMSHAEIAAATGLSEATVAARLRSLRRELREVAE